MLKRKTNIFVTILFTFVAFMLIGTTNVNAAEHILVTTEDELIAAVSEQRDTSGTTYVELRNGIALNETLYIYPIDDLILDLNGYRIVHTKENITISILYGTKDNTEGSLTIKDSSEKKTGEIKVYDFISIRGYGQEGVDNHFTLSIEGGNFGHAEGNKMFYLYDNSNYGTTHKSTYDFNVKGGYFQIKGDNAVFLYLTQPETLNMALNLKLDKLTIKANNTRLVSTLDKTDFTVEDVLAADSRFTVKNSETSKSKTFNIAITDDKETSVTKLNAIKSNVDFEFDTIEITKPWAWSVSDVTYTETVGYDTPKSESIPICNIGEDTNRILSVTVDSDNFIIEEGNKIGINSGDTDTSWKIKAKPGLAKGTYTATITLTNSVGVQYKATVTLTVEAKNLGKLKITVPKQIN